MSRCWHWFVFNSLKDRKEHTVSTVIGFKGIPCRWNTNIQSRLRPTPLPSRAWIINFYPYSAAPDGSSHTFQLFIEWALCYTRVIPHCSKTYSVFLLRAILFIKSVTFSHSVNKINRIKRSDFINNWVIGLSITQKMTTLGSISKT